MSLSPREAPSPSIEKKHSADTDGLFRNDNQHSSFFVADWPPSLIIIIKPACVRECVQERERENDRILLVDDSMPAGKKKEKDRRPSSKE